MAQDAKETVLWEAEFNPRVRTYWLLNGAIILLATVVGIPLIPVWFLVGYWLTGRYVKRLSCVLTDKALKFGKGMFVRVEKTVPLDKITDLGLVQGPIMRYLDVETLSVETAGQSSGGALLNLIGIVDGRRFRDAVLAQRDRVVTAIPDDGPVSVPAGAAAGLADAQSIQLLSEIRDSLKRIEERFPPG